MKTAEHARRPARVESGDLIVHPDAGATDCVVWFPVPDADEGTYEAEGVPGVRLSDDTVRLASIPYFPYHVGLGDTVTVREKDDVLYVVEVTEAQPALTVRAFYPGASQAVDDVAAGDVSSDDPWWRVARALGAHGVWFEQLTTDYGAYSVPPDEWEYVRPFFEAQERAQTLRWELATPMRDTAAHGQS